MAPQRISRRKVAAGVAWSVPAITIAAAAPASAASCPCTAAVSCLSTKGNFSTNQPINNGNLGFGLKWSHGIFDNTKGTLSGHGTFDVTNTCGSGDYAGWSITPVSTEITFTYNPSSGMSGTRTFQGTVNPDWTIPGPNLGNMTSLKGVFTWNDVVLTNDPRVDWDGGPATWPSYPSAVSVTFQVTDPKNPRCTCQVTVTDDSLVLASNGAHSSVFLNAVVFWIQ